MAKRGIFGKITSEEYLELAEANARFINTKQKPAPEGITWEINDVPPLTNYKVVMVEPDNQAGVSFLVDWIVTGIDGYEKTAEEVLDYRASAKY